MQKPTTPRLTTDPSMDYDTADRLSRELQDSRLHVFQVGLMMGLPKPMLTGTPEDDLRSLVVYPVLLTDGRRPWLILVADTDEWDVEEEMTELFESITPAEHFVVRASHMYRDLPTKNALPLHEPERVREIVEAEYERAFPEDTSIDHDVLLEACAAHRWNVDDEAALRARAS